MFWPVQNPVDWNQDRGALRLEASFLSIPGSGPAAKQMPPDCAPADFRGRAAIPLL
jgi:hypothetical protein